MIQANEIRVGNWFHHHVGIWSYRNDDGVISNFDDNFQWENSDWYALGECTLSLEAVEPIPLTEQILIDCGAISDNYGVFEILKQGDIYKSGCKIELWIKECEVNDERVWDISIGDNFENLIHFAFIKHLHQLQNIHFLKTGKELVYNPLNINP